MPVSELDLEATQLLELVGVSFMVEGLSGLAHSAITMER